MFVDEPRLSSNLVKNDVRNAKLVKIKGVKKHLSDKSVEHGLRQRQPHQNTTTRVNQSQLQTDSGDMPAR